jgi:hypothetical protein
MITNKIIKRGARIQIIIKIILIRTLNIRKINTKINMIREMGILREITVEGIIIKVTIKIIKMIIITLRTIVIKTITIVTTIKVIIVPIIKGNTLTPTNITAETRLLINNTNIKNNKFWIFLNKSNK